MIELSFHRTPMPEQSPAERVTNYEEVAQGYTPEMAIREAMRCLKCRKHPCMSEGCPVHNHIPDFIGKVAEGDFEAAYQILCETTCLPAICGRVCPQEKQCEGSCVRGKRYGQPVGIGNLERFVADWHAENMAETSARRPAHRGYSVAVIGSGPAGIACARELTDRGYAVTIFEKMGVAGGVLVYGIPEFRLPRPVIDAEIRELEERGVTFATNTSVGEDVTVDDLLRKKGFSAVFIGNGAGVPTTMHIPGEDHPNVFSASDYLLRINIDHAQNADGVNPLPKARRIAVIGGGNVAMDACRCAARSGAEKVYVIYRRSEAEMPAHAGEIREARDEGVKFRFLTNPTEVLANEDGSLRGLECVKMELGEPDESGRRRPEPVPNSNFILDVDQVIMAIGTGFDESIAASATGLDTDRKGGIVVKDDTATSRIGVFAGGDAVTGPDTVVRAMGAGRKAAAAIDNYLTHGV